MNKYFLPIVLISLLAVGCAPAYVSSRPLEPVIVRPLPPGPNYVWINGSWRWDRHARTHRYIDGYWAKPARRNATWEDGRWHESRRGWQYKRGHWR